MACTADHAIFQAPLTFRTNLLKYLKMNTLDTEKEDNCLPVMFELWAFGDLTHSSL